MEKLIEKIENLEKVLDENVYVQTVKNLSGEVTKDKELLNLIEKYNKTKDEQIKKQIIDNASFKNYKKAETDLNILILEINQKLKEINDKGKCSLWK